MRRALAAVAGFAAFGALAAGAACGSQPVPFNTKPPDAGVTIAIYASGNDGYAVVDDRRWIDVAGNSVMLANIDPGAELASLVIMPASTALRVGSCARERIPDQPVRDPREELAEQQRVRRAEELRRRLDGPLRPTVAPSRLRDAPPAPTSGEPDPQRFVPVVRCEIDAAPGRYLVRLVYVTKTLGYRAHHDIDVRDAARATITSRFAVPTPVWRQRAELVLYDGMPGGERTPREVARGQAELDGSTSVLAAGVREVASELRRVYEGAVVTGTDSTDAMWAHDSVQAVWVWLELADLRLAAGPIRVHLELPGEGIRDLDIAPQNRKQADEPDATLRLPLWVDESLRGSRQRIIEYNDGVSLTERLVFGVANTGDTAREVFVVEPLRKARRKKLDNAWPNKPTPDRDTLRTRLDVRAGRMERAGYTMTYDF